MDYKNFSPNGATNDNSQIFNRFWWRSKTKKELALSIQGIVKTISQYDSFRQTQYQLSSRLYGGVDVLGINGLSYTITQQQNALRDRISYNVVQSAVDTITAKIAKNRPRPLFLTSGGDYKLRRKSKKLTKFIEGIFYQNKINEMGPDAFRRACVLGDGLVHVFAQHGKIKFEHVFNRELFVDWQDGLSGNPRQMHRIKSIDKSVLRENFPNHKKEIAETNETMINLGSAYKNVSEQVTVIESWHLPSGPEATDGIHVICVGDTVLFKEEWKHDRFPFARMRWGSRIEGYWSQGLAEQIQNIQLEVNKLLWVIQRSMHLAGSFKIFIENTSKIVKEHLSNDIGAIISYTGQQPTYLTPPVVPQEVYAHLHTLKNSAFEQAGISQLSATSQKPPGLNSGKALRTYNDIETERFIKIGHEYENFHLDLADLCIMFAKEIYQTDKNFSVKVPGKKFIDTIKWADVDLDDDQYLMKVYPISSLPSDPQGRLQTVQEYVQAGFYDQRTAKKLLEFPDLESEDDLEGAMEEYIMKNLDKIVDEGEYVAPSPDDDLDLSKQLVLEYISQGKRDDLEEEKLSMLRNYNSQLDVFIAKSQPPMVPPNGLIPPESSPQGQPAAVPESPPVSQLIPNTPQ